MKDGGSRKRRILGLVGLAAIIFAGISFLSIGARVARGNFGPNSAEAAQLQAEWAEQRAEQAELNSAEASQFENRRGDWDGRHGRGDHRHGRGHHGMGLLGFMIGGLFHLAFLGLAGFGAYSLFQRMRNRGPQTSPPQARVLDEDDEDGNIDDEIKVG